MTQEIPEQEQSQQGTTQGSPAPEADSGPASQELADAWREVGRQVQQLGSNIAAAFEASMQSPEAKEQLKKLRTELEAATDELNQKAQAVADSEEGQRVRAETAKFVETAQASSQQLIAEVQPYFLAAFQQMRSGLDQIINNLEQKPAASKKETPKTEPSSDETSTTTE